MNGITERMNRLWDRVARLHGVAALGYSGRADLEEREEGADVDLFVFATAIPSQEERKAACLEALGDQVGSLEIEAIAGGPWGDADHLVVLGTDVWIMYFTTARTLEDVEATLAGKRLDREGDFYPTGRLATLLGLNVVCDDGFLKRIRTRLSEYPELLRDAMVGYHLPLAYDAEDFASAVRRADVWFYHAVLDAALEHFLQALFALNGTYFPSRKRNMSYLKSFRLIPSRCAERIDDTLNLGATDTTLETSHDLWVGLVRDLERLAAAASVRN